MQAGLIAIVEAQKRADEMNQFKGLIKQKELENLDLINTISEKDVQISSKDNKFFNDRFIIISIL